MENIAETLRLLVVSRDIAALRPLWSIAESVPCKVETCNNGWEAMERVNAGVGPHLVILDLPTGDADSLQVLRWLRRSRPELSVVVLCHPEDADKKDAALRLGADDVLIRPFADEQLELAIYLHCSNWKRSRTDSVQNFENTGEDDFFVCASPVARKLRSQAELLAQIDVPVLILGECGTGKEQIARLIHRLSVRSGFQFRKLQCSGLGSSVEKGLFPADELPGPQQNANVLNKEIVGQGVVLLDEITELPQVLQARLLARLNDGPGFTSERRHALHNGVRVLASSGANLERALADGRLREELYFRLSSFMVHLPPLRERKQEIPILLDHFMRKVSGHYGLPAREFSKSTIQRCERYSWPGNLAELEIFVKRYLVAGENDALAGQFGMQDDISMDQCDSGSALPSPPEDPTSLKSLVRNLKCETERNAIAIALEKTGWNRKAAARLLKVSYRTMLYKIDQYQMSENEPFSTSLPK